MPINRDASDCESSELPPSTKIPCATTVPFPKVLDLLCQTVLPVECTIHSLWKLGLHSASMIGSKISLRVACNSDGICFTGIAG